MCLLRTFNSISELWTEFSNTREFRFFNRLLRIASYKIKLRVIFPYIGVTCHQQIAYYKSKLQEIFVKPHFFTFHSILQEYILHNIFVLFHALQHAAELDIASM